MQYEEQNYSLPYPRFFNAVIFNILNFNKQMKNIKSRTGLTNCDLS